MTFPARALLVAALAWGAFAFGAVYPWAYWPLAGVVGALSILSLQGAGVWRSLRLKLLIIALALFAVAAALQLVPVPFRWLALLSPRVHDVVATFDLGAGAYPDRHPLSIAPRLTLTGLALFVSFALLIIGSTRLLTTRGG